MLMLTHGGSAACLQPQQGVRRARELSQLYVAINPDGVQDLMRSSGRSRHSPPARDLGCSCLRQKPGCASCGETRRPSTGHLLSVGAQLLLLLAVLAGISSPAFGARSDYCSTFAGSGKCPPCVLTGFDACKPLDNYYESSSFCIDGNSTELPRCGRVAHFNMINANASRRDVAARLSIFQDADDFLYLTFRLNCPFVVRTGVADSRGGIAPSNVAVWVWDSMPQPDAITQATPGPQYSNGITDMFSGAYTCITAVVDLKHVCNPKCSTYMNIPVAFSNHRCLGTRCPPTDFTRSPLLVIQPTLAVWQASVTCGPQEKEAGEFNVFRVNTTDSSGVVQWSPLACDLAGTPPRNLPPAPLTPPPSPFPSFPPSPWPSPPPPTPPPYPPPSPPPPPTLPPPTPPQPPSPGPPPKDGSRTGEDFNPPPPMPPVPSPPLPSPSPPEPALAPPSPRPRTPSPRPPPPVRRPPPLRSPSPRPPSPSPPPSPTPAPPPPLIYSPPTGESPSKHSSPSPLPDDDSPVDPHSLPAPPPSPAPPSPEAAPSSSGGGKNSFLSGAGIGVLIGCSAVAVALCCCCTITLYVFCRRSSREQVSVNGDDATPALPCESTGRDDGSNFSFDVKRHACDGDRRDSSCGASFSAGMTFGDMEKGRGLETGSLSGDSSFPSRPLSFQSDLPSPSQVFVTLDRSSPGQPRSLLNAHAACAAAMGAQARQMAAMGGAAAAASKPPNAAAVAAAAAAAAAAAVAAVGPTTPAPAVPNPVAPSPVASAATITGGASTTSQSTPSPPPTDRMVELRRKRGRFGRIQQATATAAARITVDCQSVDLLPPSPTDGDGEAGDAAEVALSLQTAPGDPQQPGPQRQMSFLQMIRRGSFLRTATSNTALDQMGSTGVSSSADRPGSMTDSAASLSPANSQGLLPSLLQRLQTLQSRPSPRSVPAGGGAAGSPSAAADATASGGSSSGSSAGPRRAAGSGGSNALSAGSSSGGAASQGGASSKLYPSVFAVPPSANPEGIIAAPSFSLGSLADAGSPAGGISAGGSGHYPSLFGDAGGGLASVPSITPSGSRRPPSPLATIPSMGPLVLPESTFATHAPLDLDEEDEDHGAAGQSLRTLAPYGSAEAAATLAPFDEVDSSSSTGSTITVCSPSLRGLGSGFVRASVPSNLSGSSGPDAIGAASGSSRGGNAAAGHGVSVGGRGTAGGVGADLSPPRSPFGGAAAQPPSGGLMFSGQSPPRSTPEPDGTFSFRSMGGSGAAGSGLSGANSLPVRGNSTAGEMSPGSPFRRGGSSTNMVGNGVAATAIAAGAGGALPGRGSAGGSRAGSPLRNASSVGYAPGRPLSMHPPPSSLLGAGGAAGGTPGSPPSPVTPLQVMSEITPVATPAAPSSALATRGSVSGSQTSSLVLTPPPPLHLQPITGPYGSILQSPMPLSLRPRNSLPAPGTAGGPGLSPFASSLSGSPVAASPPRNSSPPSLATGAVGGGFAGGSGRASPPSFSPPSSSPLRHASSSGMPGPSGGSVTSSAGGSPLSISGRQSSQQFPGPGGNNSFSTGGAGPIGGSNSVRIPSLGSLQGANNSSARSGASSSMAWSTNAAAFLDLDSIKRYCSIGAAAAADGVGNGFRGLAAMAGGCDGEGEEVPLSGVPGDGLTALYAAVCQLQPGAKYFNKYKIRDSPILGRHAVVVLAKNVWSKARVAIKFHADHRQYEREKAMLRQLSSAYVPAMEEPLEGPAVEALGLPPALVMEAGRCTLTEWLRGDGGAARDMLALKTALHQILAAMMHLHQHRVVHRDIKPANIMWFEDAHRFKLIDLAESATVGEAALPCCTPLYSAPEQLKAALEGAPCAAAVTTHADMWSFGVVAFEVLSGGCRFYGPSPVLSEVLEAVFGHRPLPSEGEHSALAGFELSQARRLISHLVVRSPAQRWSAAVCHRNALFASGDDTDQRAAKWDSMLNRITEVHQVMSVTNAEMRTAQMAINFTICEADSGGAGSAGGTVSFDRNLSTASGLSSAASSRSGTPPRLHHMDSSRISRAVAYRPVPMMMDDCLPNEPVFMLLTQRTYQIRISVAHARGLKLDIDHIDHLKLTTPDNQTQLLPVRLETGLRDGGAEFVAEWDPVASGSKHLAQVTATEGPIQRRVVFLNVELVVHLSALPQPITVNAMLYVVIERKSLRYTMAKFKLWSSDRWSQAPQWMRDVAKGTMVLVRVAGNVVGV